MADVAQFTANVARTALTM